MKRKGLVALSLVLLELPLCVGMFSIVQATVVTLSELSGMRAGASAVAEALQEQRFAVDGPAALTVDNSYGAVRIVAGASDEITMSAHKQVWAPTPADARVALAALELQTTKEGNAITVQQILASPTTFSLDVLRPEIDITVTVPTTTAVKSNLLIRGITLSGTSGDAELIANRGSIRVNKVEGSLQMQSDSGDITAERVRGQIQITSNRGTLHLADIRTEGELIAKTITGNVLLDDCAAKSIVVQIDRGKATLTGCTAQDVQVDTGAGDVSLGQVGADTLHLQTRRGTIGVHGASGSLCVRADIGNVTLTNGDQATLDVHTQRGTISYTGSLGQGPHELQSDSGDIQSSLPKETALNVDLQTGWGEINSQFAIAVIAGGDKNSWRGVINGGGAALKADTRNGNIVLVGMKP